MESNRGSDARQGTNCFTCQKSSSPELLTSSCPTELTNCVLTLFTPSLTALPTSVRDDRLRNYSKSQQNPARSYSKQMAAKINTADRLHVTKAHLQQ